MELSKEQKLLEQIISEAWENPSFINELKATPVEAIKNLTGETINVPEGVTSIKVVDRTDSTCMHIIIPKRPNLDDVELSEEQLESIAGGEETLTSVLLDLDPGFTL